MMNFKDNEEIFVRYGNSVKIVSNPFLKNFLLKECFNNFIE